MIHFTSNIFQENGRQTHTIKKYWDGNMLCTLTCTSYSREIRDSGKSSVIFLTNNTTQLTIQTINTANKNDFTLAAPKRQTFICLLFIYLFIYSTLVLPGSPAEIKISFTTIVCLSTTSIQKVWQLLCNWNENMNEWRIVPSSSRPSNNHDSLRAIMWSSQLLEGGRRWL